VGGLTLKKDIRKEGGISGGCQSSDTGYERQPYKRNVASTIAENMAPSFPTIKGGERIEQSTTPIRPEDFVSVRGGVE